MEEENVDEVNFQADETEKLAIEIIETTLQS